MIHHIADGILHLYFSVEKTDSHESKTVLYLDGDWNYQVSGELKIYKLSEMPGSPKEWFRKWEDFAERDPLGTLVDVAIQNEGRKIKFSFTDNQQLTIVENDWGGAELSQEIKLPNGEQIFIHDRLLEDHTDFEHIEVSSQPAE